jgi:hypothetical protein
MEETKNGDKSSDFSGVTRRGLEGTQPSLETFEPFNKILKLL